MDNQPIRQLMCYEPDHFNTDSLKVADLLVFITDLAFITDAWASRWIMGGRRIWEVDMEGELSFFELGVDDVDRGRAFYGGLFGWDFVPGPSSQGFAIATPTLPGGMHGGDPGAAPYVFFRVADMSEAIERVRQLGGTVEEPDVEGDDESVQRFGRFKLCRDDQGSTFGLHEPPPAR